MNPVATDEQILDAVKAGKSQVQIERELHCCHRRIVKLVGLKRRPTMGTLPGLSKDEFAKLYDDDVRAAAAVRSAVATIEAGVLVRDMDLRQRASFGDARLWRAAAEAPEFCKYQLRARGGGSETIYWSDPATITEMVERYRARCTRIEPKGRAT